MSRAPFDVNNGLKPQGHIEFSPAKVKFTPSLIECCPSGDGSIEITDGMVWYYDKNGKGHPLARLEDLQRTQTDIDFTLATALVTGLGQGV